MILQQSPLEKCGRRSGWAQCLSWVINGPWVVQQRLPLLPCERTSSVSRTTSEKCQQRKSPLLFDHLVATGEHLATMVIRAARLAAILLRIARDRRPAKGPAR